MKQIYTERMKAAQELIVVSAGWLSDGRIMLGVQFPDGLAHTEVTKRPAQGVRTQYRMAELICDFEDSLNLWLNECNAESVYVAVRLAVASAIGGIRIW